MGRDAAPHSSQRLRLLLVKIITNATIEEGWGIEHASTDGKMINIQQWCQEREEIFGRDTPQRFTLELDVYQEDILAIAIREKAAHTIDEGLPFILEKR